MMKLISTLATILVGIATSWAHPAFAEPTREEIHALKDVVELIDRRRAPVTKVLTADGSDAAMAMAEGDLQAFRDEVNAAMTPEVRATAAQLDARRVQSLVKRSGMLADRRADSIAQTDVARVKANATGTGYAGKFVTLIFDWERLRMFDELFPGQDTITGALAKAQPVMASFGTSFAHAAEVRAEKELELAAKMRMRPARQSNGGLEQRMWNALRGNALVDQVYRDATLRRIHLTDGGWTVERNSLTGIIIGRYQRADLALVASDGSCHLYSALFEQKATGGGGYGNLYFRSGTPRLMLCENIPG